MCSLLSGVNQWPEGDERDKRRSAVEADEAFGFLG